MRLVPRGWHAAMAVGTIALGTAPAHAPVGCD